MTIVRRAWLPYLGLAVVAATAAAGTYAGSRAVQSSSHEARPRTAARTAGPTSTRPAAADAAEVARRITPPESRVPRGLTPTIVARLVQRTLHSGGVEVKRVTCIAGAPGSGRYGCAYIRQGACFASLVDLSTGSVNFADESKRDVPLASCTARNAFPST